jgi:hypothetical protein
MQTLTKVGPSGSKWQPFTYNNSLLHRSVLLPLVLLKVLLRRLGLLARGLDRLV